MRITVIFGGPIQKRQTDQVLHRFLQGFERPVDQIERFDLFDMTIKPCNACMGCSSTGRCVIDDDMTKLYTAFDHADMVIVASPMYFNSVTSVTKLMIDRCQSYWAKIVLLRDKPTYKKIGVVIATGGSKVKTNETDGILLVTDLLFKAIGVERRAFHFLAETDRIPMGTREVELATIQLSAYQLRESIENTVV